MGSVELCEPGGGLGVTAGVDEGSPDREDAPLEVEGAELTGPLEVAEDDVIEDPISE